jgi:hypothetical protein
MTLFVIVKTEVLRKVESVSRVSYPTTCLVELSENLLLEGAKVLISKLDFSAKEMNANKKTISA